MPFTPPASLVAATVCFLDTNILVRWSELADPKNGEVRATIQAIVDPGVTPHHGTQNSVEAYRTLTRPVASGGYGLAPASALQRLSVYERAFVRLPETELVYTYWLRLMAAYNVSGKQVHDARLVAAMQANRLTHIVTYNEQDFKRYTPEGIVVVVPT